MTLSHCKFINVDAPSMIQLEYNDRFKWQDGSIFTSICSERNIYLPLVVQHTVFQDTVGYDVVWSENQQPVVAKLNESQLFDAVQLEQTLDLSSRKPIYKKDACSRLLPNCCATLPTVDKAMTQIYAEIKYTNDNLNITTTRPTHIGTIEDSYVLPCPPDTSWQSIDGYVGCYKISCPAGQEVNGYDCVKCPRGTSKSVAGTHSCSTCDENSFAEAEGALGCTVCDLGTAMVANKDGVLHCELCRAGTYQNAKGQTSCISCPMDTFSPTTGNTAPAQCLKCAADFALYTTTNYSVGVANASGCVCQGIDTTIEGNVGYYTNPTPTNKEDYCLRCPNGALCTNPNTKLSTLGTKPGYWRSSMESNVFHECLNDIDCPGNSNQSSQCRQGNTGVICAVCAANHVRFNDGLCTKCKQGANAIGLPLMILAFGFVYIFILARFMAKVKTPPKPKPKPTVN